MPSIPTRGFGEDGLLVTGGVGASEGAVVNSAAIATTQRAQTSSIDVVTIAVLHPRKRRMVAPARRQAAPVRPQASPVRSQASPVYTQQVWPPANACTVTTQQAAQQAQPTVNRCRLATLQATQHSRAEACMDRNYLIALYDLIDDDDLAFAMLGVAP